MPVNQFLLFVVDMVIIFGNLYLYKFLQLDTERREKGVLTILYGYYGYLIIFLSIVVQNLDVKKERRRNLIPAKIGIYAIFILIFFILFHYITYSIEMNNCHRALLHAIASDAYYCIVAPTIVLYSIPSVVRNIKAKYLNIVS